MDNIESLKSKLALAKKYKSRSSVVGTDELEEVLSSLQEQVQKLAAENRAKSNCLSFFASVIKCGESWSETCQRDYDAAFKTPATDAVIREIQAHARAEGIHFAANRLLAAWESGFVDDTPAAAHDISGAILSAVEFLPNADEAEFKRDYADEVRARLRAGDQP